MGLEGVGVFEINKSSEERREERRGEQGPMKG